MTGFVLGFTKGKRQRRELWEECDRIWYTIDRKQLNQVLRRLKLGGLVTSSTTTDGIEKFHLTPAGRNKFLRHQFNTLVPKKEKTWNGKWKIVLFDVPEFKRRTRDGLRKKLKEMGFLEFQKSVFIFPYRCEDEINFIINFLDIAEHVYYLEAAISPDVEFRRHFNL